MNFLRHIALTIRPGRIYLTSPYTAVCHTKPYNLASDKLLTQLFSKCWILLSISRQPLTFLLLGTHRAMIQYKNTFDGKTYYFLLFTGDVNLFLKWKNVFSYLLLKSKYYFRPLFILHRMWKRYNTWPFAHPNCSSFRLRRQCKDLSFTGGRFRLARVGDCSGRDKMNYCRFRKLFTSKL